MTTATKVTPGPAKAAPAPVKAAETPKIDPLAFLSGVKIETTEQVRESQAGALLDAHPEFRAWIKEANADGKPRRVPIPAGFEKRVENLLRMAAKELNRGLTCNYTGGHLKFQTKDLKATEPAPRRECSVCHRIVSQMKDGHLRNHKTPAGQDCTSNRAKVVTA